MNCIPSGLRRPFSCSSDRNCAQMTGVDNIIQHPQTLTTLIVWVWGQLWNTANYRCSLVSFTSNALILSPRPPFTRKSSFRAPCGGVVAGFQSIPTRFDAPHWGRRIYTCMRHQHIHIIHQVPSVLYSFVYAGTDVFIFECCRFQLH